MLGATDDSAMLDLFAAMLSGQLKDAIGTYRKIISSDASPAMIIARLMDYVHLASCMKSNVEPLSNILSETYETKFKQIVETTNLATLTRLWQMLIKGVNELKFTDRPELILEMLLIRIVYSSGLPDLHQVIQKLESGSLENSNQHGINQSRGTSSLIENAMSMFPNATIQK